MPVRSKVDISRLASAVQRPGIDPRIWLSLATVEAVGFDAAEGIFVDVQYQPTGERETAYLGIPYSGAEFGMHCPVNVGDTVMVAVAGGDPQSGPVVVTRWHNSGDKPNADLQDENDATEPTKDLVLRVQAGQKLRVRTSGAGDIDLEAEGTGKVVVKTNGGDVTVNSGSGTIRLGDGTETVPLKGVVTGESVDSFTGATYAALGQSSTKVGATK